MKFWVAVGAVVLVCCGSAQAAVPYEAGRPMQRWQAIGAARFPDGCRPVALYVGELPEGALAWSDLGACSITFAPEFFTRTRIQRCTLIVHEYGHLAGLEHSDDPNSIMYPEPLASASTRCQRFQWPYRGEPGT